MTILSLETTEYQIQIQYLDVGQDIFYIGDSGSRYIHPIDDATDRDNRFDYHSDARGIAQESACGKRPQYADI